MFDENAEKFMEEERRLLAQAIPHEKARDMIAKQMNKQFGDLPSDGVISDISAFVNVERLLSQSDIDEFRLFDLDTVVNLVVLHERTCVLQPFDDRYPDMADFEWLDKSTLAKELHEKGILVIRPISGFETESWHTTEGFFQSGGASRLVNTWIGAPKAKMGQVIHEQTWGYGRQIHDYNMVYTKMYSPWIYQVPKATGRKLGKHWTLLSLLVYRVNECLEYSRKSGLPYHPSALKVPFVKTIIDNNEARLKELVDSLFRTLDRRESSKAMRLNEAFGRNQFEVQTPAMLSVALEGAASREDLVDRLLALRENAVKLRRRISEMKNMSRKEASEELKTLSRAAFSGSTPTESHRLREVPEEVLSPVILGGELLEEIGSFPYLNEAGKLSSQISSRALLRMVDYLDLHLRKRHLLFLREISNSAAITPPLGDSVNRLFGNFSGSTLQSYWNIKASLGTIGG